MQSATGTIPKATIWKQRRLWIGTVQGYIYQNFLFKHRLYMLLPLYYSQYARICPQHGRANQPNEKPPHSLLPHTVFHRYAQSVQKCCGSKSRGCRSRLACGLCGQDIGLCTFFFLSCSALVYAWFVPKPEEGVADTVKNNVVPPKYKSYANYRLLCRDHLYPPFTQHILPLNLALDVCRLSPYPMKLPTPSS